MIHNADPLATDRYARLGSSSKNNNLSFTLCDKVILNIGMDISKKLNLRQYKSLIYIYENR